MADRVHAGVLTISDKGSQGKRIDESGEVVHTMLAERGYAILQQAVIPDELERIADTLTQWVDMHHLSLIVTSGGTGLTPRDVTPQATKKVIDYEVPGMAEAMRAASMKRTPHAMLSRAVVGVRKRSLIINLPGSPGGARDNLAVILPALDHALSKLAGDPSDCAS
jgi:molybdopterin adenylyltransferase